uniref:Uncharacterized protein n=1 Tax=Oryza meridionalis TaxID=40149 RepID=A0A0E0C3M3_9ORYZ
MESSSKVREVVADLEKISLFPEGGFKPLIHKIPALLRNMENAGSLFDPDVVAIGPCHHDNPDLQGMENIKKMAAKEFCSKSEHKVSAFYLTVQKVSGQASKCYPASIDLNDFTDMMFYDGCFLLQFIKSTADRRARSPWTDLIRRMGLWDSIARDVLLLENQIPWVVLEALMSLKHVSVDRFIAYIISWFDEQMVRPQVQLDKYRPSHLLDLVRHFQIGSRPTKVEPISEPRLAISAIKLAENGIHFEPSETTRFGDITVVKKRFLFGKISLPPLFLGRRTMCWLANMVAFERTQAGRCDCGVGSYMHIIAGLMNSEEDVRELRTKGILYPVFSDKQTLKIFKSITQHVPYGYDYMRIRTGIDDYHRQRKLAVTLHRFLYNNFRFFLMAGSVIGILVTILKAIMSVKQGNTITPYAPPRGS